MRSAASPTIEDDMSYKKGNWVVNSSKIIYQNPWIKVTEDQVIRPDGKNGIFGVVELKPGASILPIDERGNVYLIKEYHYATEQDDLEVVSGGIDQNESILEGAKRELLEEAGIKAQQWTGLGFTSPFTTEIRGQQHMFIAKGLSFTTPSPDGTEQIEVIKIPYKEARNMVDNGKITHAASVILILRAGENLN